MTLTPPLGEQLLELMESIGKAQNAHVQLERLYEERRSRAFDEALRQVERMGKK